MTNAKTQVTRIPPQNSDSSLIRHSSFGFRHLLQPGYAESARDLRHL
jgi:hypothetical protein